ERIANVTYTHPNEDGSLSTETLPDITDPAMQVAAQMGQRAAAPPADFARAGRNDPCPCGSGKKFKLCHGKLA
ncbi:MAG: SEC-C domain-containing protein, partial [Burkholderiaceae bacterium]|nr:SEC-C domain-containing protein [Burkholderiaceae bacterium]